MSKGSTGQPKVNPLIELVLKLEDKMLKLENELGLTPLARQRLGIAFGEAAMNLTNLTEILENDWDDYEDPRIIEISAEEE